MTFPDALKQDARAIADCLTARLAPLGNSDVAAGMRYATAGGKRLRGYLVLETARLTGADPDRAVIAAAAVECLHGYSLVHDDLPAMDDDDLRRGQPTVHVKWDEATAILVGDALQSFAFQLLCDPKLSDDPAIRVALIDSLARAAGAQGMVLGQAQDIAAESASQPLTLDQITALQANKTGALIAWSAEAGPRLAGVDPAPFAAYARATGLAFQIADDILDVTGDSATTGKRTQKDAAAGKATFVSLLGLDAAREMANALVTEAEDALAPFGARAQGLRELARYIVRRDA